MSCTERSIIFGVLVEKASGTPLMKDKREYFTPSQLEALKISLFPVKPEVLLIKSELYEIFRNVFFIDILLVSNFQVICIT